MAKLTPSTSDRATYHHGDLRAALVAAALNLLAQDGAEAVSLRAVARAAGVSAMAPYRHFPDKESLLAAVAAAGFDGLHAVLLAADREPEPLRAQAASYVRYALDHPALFRLMFGPVRPAAHPKLHEAGETAYAVLARRVMASGDPDPEAARLRTLGCWSLVHGLAFLLLDGRIEPPPPGDAEALARLVAGAMLPA